MSEQGMIVIRQEWQGEGIPPKRFYSWQGPDETTIDAFSLREDGLDLAQALKTRRVTVGPFVLLVMDYQPWSGQLVCIRDRRLNWLRVKVYEAKQTLKLTKVRLILTARIWGLAEDLGPAQERWSNVYVVASIQRFFKRFRL